MKHENGKTEIITVAGIELMATVEDYEGYTGFDGWVNIAYLGSIGLVIDRGNEWAGFVELVKKIDAYILDKHIQVV